MTIGNYWDDEARVSDFSCVNCGDEIMDGSIAAMCDEHGNTFCSQECLNEYWHNNFIDWSATPDDE